MPNTFGNLSKASEIGLLVSLFFLTCYLGKNISIILNAVNSGLKPQNYLKVYWRVLTLEEGVTDSKVITWH